MQDLTKLSSEELCEEQAQFWWLNGYNSYNNADHMPSTKVGVPLKKELMRRLAYYDQAQNSNTSNSTELKNNIGKNKDPDYSEMYSPNPPKMNGAPCCTRCIFPNCSCPRVADNPDFDSSKFCGGV